MAGACPAVQTLELALRSSIPLLTGTYKEWDKSTQKRLQVAGNPRHQMGVCLDIILFCRAGLNPDKALDWNSEKILGENLVQAFVDLREEMKWTEIIFQDRFFWEPEYYKHYGSDEKHFTHIHIDWMTNSLKGHNKTEAEVLAGSPQKDTNTFSGSLTPRLTLINSQFEAGSLSSISLASIQRKYRPEVNAVGTWQVRVDKWLWNYTFNADGTVTWQDPFSKQSGTGKWQVAPGEITFTWFNSKTTEKWITPINPTAQTGKTTMQGITYDVNAVKI